MSVSNNPFSISTGITEGYNPNLVYSESGPSTFSFSLPTYDFGVGGEDTARTFNRLSDFNSLADVWGNPGKFLTAEFGSGKNATNLLTLGGTVGLGLWGIHNQNKNFDKQLAEARANRLFAQKNAMANFLTSGTGYLDQGLHQVQALSDFNKEAGAERANNFMNAAQQVANAGTSLGLSGDAFNGQINSLSKYTTLTPNVNAQPDNQKRLA